MQRQTFENLPAVAVLEIVGELALVLVAGSIEVEPVPVLEAVLEGALVRAGHAELRRVLVLPPHAAKPVRRTVLETPYDV